MDINYENYVKPYSSNFHLINLEQDKVKLIDDFVKKMRVKKKEEYHHLIDNDDFYQRFYTGMLGEIALEKFLGVDNIVNWEVGNSVDFHKNDLSNLNLNVGIKTVKYGQFPIVFKKNYNHEIIMIRWKSRHVYICGLAKKDILNKYQSDDLIINHKLRQRSTKSAFYGFQYLEHFANLEELRSILNLK